MATRFTKTEETYVYPLLGPQDINTGKTGNYVSMKNYNHARIIIVIGACAATSDLVIKEATSVTGTSAQTWTGWDYVMKNGNYSLYNTEDASDTKDVTKTAVSSYTYALGTTANVMLIIEFDASQLSAGYDCFSINFSNPGATDLVCAIVELSEPRYSGVGTNPPDARTN